MNDTEKIEGLMNELEEIEKEKKDNVPVITKEYVVEEEKQEEKEEEVEKTKLIDSLQEEIEEAKEEEQEEPPVLIPLPDKNKKKKKIIMIILIIAIIVIILATIIISILAKPKKEKPVVNNDDIISMEDYKKAVDGYGDAVTIAYKELKEKNKHITNVTIEDLDIEYKDYKVTCSEVYFNFDKSVYLDDCMIKGYDNQYNYQYGEKETEDNKYKLYIYQTKDVMGYSFDKDQIEQRKKDLPEENLEIKKTLVCKQKDCKVYINGTLTNDFVIYDDSKYTLYNLEKDSKKTLKGLGKEVYESIICVYNAENKLQLLQIRDSNTGNIGFYHVNRDKIIAKPEYTGDYTTPCMMKQGYLALTKKVDDTHVTLYIINQITGQLKKQLELENFRGIEDFFTAGWKDYRIDANGKIITMDSNFQIIPDKPTQSDPVNTENTENTENANTTEEK